MGVVGQFSFQCHFSWPLPLLLAAPPPETSATSATSEHVNATFQLLETDVGRETLNDDGDHQYYRRSAAPPTQTDTEAAPNGRNCR